MQHHIKVRQYLEIICNQVRCKKIHNDICEEIENHIVDQKEAYIEKGMDDETAILKAIEQMGDPVIVGTELDRTHRPKPEWSIIFMTFLLLLTGILIRLYTSPQDISGLALFNRQLFFTVVGIGVLALCYHVDFTILGKYPKTIYILLIAIIILLFAYTRPINGRHIYASYPFLLFPTSFAGITYSMRNRRYTGVIFCELFFTIPFVLSLMVSNMSSSILLVISCLMILTIAILKNWFQVKKSPALLLVYLPVIISMVIVFASGILSRRIAIAINPSVEPLGKGFIANITRQLLSGAKFIGQGTLTENIQKVFDVHAPMGINSDFLLTYTTHRFGWIAFIVVVTTLTVFIIRAFILCIKQKSVLAVLVSTAATLTFTIQALLYIVANLGFQLFEPLSLPFISQSSSYLLVNMCLVGILLSVFRTGYFINDRNIIEKATITPS